MVENHAIDDIFPLSVDVGRHNFVVCRYGPIGEKLISDVNFQRKQKILRNFFKNFVGIKFTRERKRFFFVFA